MEKVGGTPGLEHICSGGRGKRVENFLKQVRLEIRTC